MTTVSERKGKERRYTGLELAVIGMSGRFPGATDIDRFWAGLVDGVDAVSRFTDEELLASGVTPEEFGHENYVRARGVFPDLENFDSTFFNYTPADAAVLDPQVRALHEEVFHALEDAGYSADGRGESIGLFLGATNNLPWETHTLRTSILRSGVMFAGMQLNDKDFAATRIAYALDLKGPALSLNTACSTSLVAIDMACRYLWTGACQIAVAGGSGLTLPHRRGYLYQENMIHSPDGSCRAFDKDAAGTVEGNGAGAVVLKRLETALRDGDHIYAVLKGSAVNNDGDRKVGYTAPSIEGQAEVIRKAHRVAGVKPSEVAYVETHGTGTALGDPIEVEALRKAFGSAAPRTVGLGSLKASIGHLDAAAGVASLIKACKIVENRTIPRSLHFTEPNPNLGLNDTPFYVVARKEERAREGTGAPLRVGVSAFGIGGTNAHVVLEEAPAAAPAARNPRRHHTFVAAASSAEALERIKRNFVAHLAAHPDTDGGDLAWTLQNRQRQLGHRYAVEFQDARGLRDRLQESLDAGEEPVHLGKNTRRDIHFLFSGTGSQHLRMARDLHATEEAFRGHLEECFSLAEERGNTAPREVFFGDGAETEKRMNSMETTQLILFMLEYSLAKTLIGWGVKPRGLIGHSTGELAAACVAGVFSLADGVRLVEARGSLMSATPEGAMTSVKASEEQVGALLPEELTLAAVNSPEDCTVSGAVADVIEFERRCTEGGIGFTRVKDLAHAAHSRFMDGMLDEFRAVIATVTFQPPRIPYVSNVTGTWITAEQATDPEYYCTQIRQAVRFKAGVETILARGETLFVEVGPGKSLSSFVRTIGRGTGVVSVNMLRHRMEEVSDDEHLARAVKRLWEAGCALDWKAFHQGRGARKLHLPLYPFDRTAYPVDVTEFHRILDPAAEGIAPAETRPARAALGHAAPGLSPAAHRMVWSRTMLPAATGKPKPRVLVVLTDDAPRLGRVLDGIPHWRALFVTFGPEYRFDGPSGAVVRADHEDDLKRLVADLEEHALVGDTFLVHREDPASLDRLVRGLCAVVPGMKDPGTPDVVVLDTVDALRNRAGFLPRILGLNHEFPGVRVRAVRCDAPLTGRRGRAAWGAGLSRELAAERPEEAAVRYEDGQRLAPLMVPLHGPGGVSAGRTGRTAVLCRTGDLAPLLAEAAEGRSPYIVLPFGPATDPVPDSGTPGDGRVTVLPEVTGETWAEVAQALATRVRGLAEIDGIVLLDTPAQAGQGSPADRRALLDLLREAGRERGIPCHVLSRPVLDRQGWDAGVTHWFAENALIDRETGVPRLYSSAPLLDGDPSPLRLLQQLGESDIGTAYHGLDPLALPPAGPSATGEETPAAGGERQSLAALMERELVNLLGFDRVGTREDIFDLGLDSVRLIRFLSVLEEQGHKILPGDVYNHPTVDGLAGFLTRSVTPAGVEAASPESVAELREEHPADGDSAAPGIGDPAADDRAPAADDRALAAAVREIDRCREELRRSIAARPVKWTYPLGGMQKHHFASEDRLQLYLIELREPVDADVLQRALCDVIGRHGLLRSFVFRSLGRLRWKEFEAPAALELPRVDLSGLDPRRQEEWRTALAQRAWELDRDFLDRPLYEVALLKYHERSYDLLFRFDHSVFDAASGQTFRTDLLQRYRELLDGTTRAMPTALSYRHLQRRIHSGPVDITADGIVEAFELERYARTTQVIKERSAPRANGRTQQVRYSVDLTALRADGSPEPEPFSLALRLYARVVARLLDVDEVAAELVVRSRSLGDKDYSEVMGMALDTLPVVISGERDADEDPAAVVGDRIRLMNRHNIGFLDLVHDLRSALAYRKVTAVTREVMGKAPCVFNFAGTVEDEYDAIWDMTLEQLAADQDKGGFADCYGMAKTGNGRLDLVLMCAWVDGPEDIIGILDEEVRFLTRDDTISGARSIEKA
ncbi:beta-ketoacyl synthase N-terminal-like domain-containing protein [Streptomyces sp. NPDC000594]|uniref:beta-ketoacyl synthase N-terminal-like domain-containing protein n=1 Tax=Streptomyces sp. NPDC000594 TaxID=3154261 RepID=UPI0033346049